MTYISVQLPTDGDPFTDVIVVDADGNKILQEEDQPLSSYNGVTNGTVLLLIVLTPFELYVQGVDGRMFTITVKSAQPDVRLLSCVCSLCIFVDTDGRSLS